MTLEKGQSDEDVTKPCGRERSEDLGTGGVDIVEGEGDNSVDRGCRCASVVEFGV